MLKIKIALVGLGRISKTHINAILKSNSKYQLKYLVHNKTDKSVFEKYKSFPDVLITTKFEKILNDPDVNLIVLCTPSNLHYEQFVKCNKYNKIVLCEKPITFTKMQAANLLQKTTIRNFVALQNRFNQPVIDLKKLITENALGKIFQVNINLFWSRTQEYFNQNAWRGKKIQDGLLINQGYHYLDILIWLFGMPKNVYATVKTSYLNIEAEDSVSAILELKDGGVCNLTMSLLAKSDMEGSINIIAENADVKIGGKALNKVVYVKGINNKSISDSLKINDYHDTSDNVYGSGHIDLYKAIYDNLVNKKHCDNLATIKDDYKINILIDAIRLSSDSNSKVNILD